MKKIKLFTYNVQSTVTSIFGSGENKFTHLEQDVNDFLSKDGTEIEVLDVQYQQSNAKGIMILETVMVYYKELNK